jgi:hypothetical protein
MKPATSAPRSVLIQKFLANDSKRYSFPELNEQLLFALRRAQARLARLQSWSCIAADEKRRSSIAEQIREADEDPLDLKPLEAKQAWNLIAAKLITELETERITHSARACPHRRPNSAFARTTVGTGTSRRRLALPCITPNRTRQRSTPETSCRAARAFN